MRYGLRRRSGVLGEPICADLWRGGRGLRGFSLAVMCFPGGTQLADHKVWLRGLGGYLSNRWRVSNTCAVSPRWFAERLPEKHMSSLSARRRKGGSFPGGPVDCLAKRSSVAVFPGIW